VRGKAKAERKAETEAEAWHRTINTDYLDGHILSQLVFVSLVDIC